MIFKVAITNTNQIKEKPWKRRPPQREVFFKTRPSEDLFVKVIGVLGFPFIIFTYAPKSSKSYVVLNIFKIGWFYIFN